MGGGPDFPAPAESGSFTSGSVGSIPDASLFGVGLTFPGLDTDFPVLGSSKALGCISIALLDSLIASVSLTFSKGSAIPAVELA